MVKIYSERIKRRVVWLFGEDSEVFQALIKGEEISKLIKKSISKKGLSQQKIKDKVLLFKDCKKIEQSLSDDNEECVEI